MSSSWIREKNKNWDGTYIKPWKRVYMLRKLDSFISLKKKSPSRAAEKLFHLLWASEFRNW